MLRFFWGALTRGAELGAMVWMGLRCPERQFVVDKKNDPSLVFWGVVLDGQLEG